MLIVFTFKSKKVKIIFSIDAISDVMDGKYKCPHAIKQAEKVCIIGKNNTDKDASFAILIVMLLSLKFKPRYKIFTANLEKINEKWKIFFSDGYLLYMLLIPLLLILMPFICMITFVRYCLPKSSLKKLQIDDVIDVQYKQSIYGKIFNYGTIIFVWKNKKRCFLMIQNPQKVCEEIKLFLKI